VVFANNSSVAWHRLSAHENAILAAEVDVTRNAKRVIVGSIILCVILVPLSIWFYLLRPPADRRAFGAISMEWNHAGTKAEPEVQSQLAQRCLDVNRQYPGSVGGMSALLLAAVKAPHTPAGQEASRLFTQQIDHADLNLLAAAFDRATLGYGASAPLAPPLLARIRRAPDHPRCGRLLAACCTMTRPQEDGEPSALYREAADMIAERHAARLDIHHFCEGLANLSGSPPWAVQFERHLRAILETNRERKVRCAAKYALAWVVMAVGEERQQEAQALFEEFCSEFDGTHEYSYQSIEQSLRQVAQAQLKELKFRAAGKLAPQIDGLDLDGRPLKLSDYRGRVVLLNFWGTWCFPCMKLVPHERELAAKYHGRPFDILGVNCDDDVEEAQAAAARTEMTWRSIRNQSGDPPRIAQEWKILGFPTLYLIDHHGMIRKRWIGSPPPEDLQQMTEALVGAAERRVPADAMGAVLAAMSARPAEPLTSPSPGPADGERPRTRFVDKVYREADGTELKYVVYVPPIHDTSKPAPAILYLHGSGPRGTDGKAHLEHGLALAIRDYKSDFPFLVIFPQARPNEDWQAGTPGGRRALAILEQTTAEYRIDPDRIALTGVSMGAAGTWSLAANDPGRWSAIVPISHGGDIATAAKLVGVPCWCFHGEADRMIQPQQSREMVAAIINAGGRPLYHELPGVGHNDCAERVYAMDDLVEWLLAQNRSRR
jgi:acetyl esterase/lipase